MNTIDSHAGGAPQGRAVRLARAWRIGWTVLSVSITQLLVCAVALLPPVWIWIRIADWTDSIAVRTLLFAVLALPSYAIFALVLMIASALTARALGWRTPARAEMPIDQVEWPVLRWVRSMVMIHIVRLLAGALFRGSPIWTAYLRLAGARLGRRVYVNSLSLSDYNLLEFGDDVVVGEHVHLSGHTVEHGVVKTGPVRLGRNVTIGLGSVIEIGVEVGDGSQIGALSFVPKYSHLSPHSVYAGSPVHRIEPSLTAAANPGPSQTHHHEPSSERS